MASTEVRDPERLAAGHAALASAEWDLARERFADAVGRDDDPAAWEGLSWANWWLGDQEQTLTSRERAYRGYRQADDVRGAARTAMWLASDHLDFQGDDALAAAWLRRGQELLRDHEPCPELGYLTLLDADLALLARSDPGTAAALAADAIAIAREISSADIQVVGLALLGSALIASGQVDDGLRHLAECGALAVGEDFSDTVAPGWALCHTVSACAEIGDFAQAEQWCRALHTWAATWRARHFFGICRTAYGACLAKSGDWPSAEQELRSALDDLRTARPGLAAPAAVRLGRLRMRQGDTAAARELFETALPLPQAVIALGELDLANGDPRSAADAAHRALRRVPAESVLERFPALELLARARAASDDPDGAADTVAELEREAARLATPYMRGRAGLARTAVLAAAGAHEDARRCAEDTIDLFASCDAPYEAAEARLLLSGSLHELGRRDRAETEARTAREAFALLGAEDHAPSFRGGERLSPRETDILRLVADGLGDTRIAERLFISPHTVHRHLANIRTKLGVSSRAAAVAQATRSGLL